MLMLTYITGVYLHYCIYFLIHGKNSYFLSRFSQTISFAVRLRKSEQWVKFYQRPEKKVYDCRAITQRLRAMLQSADEQVRSLKKQSTFLSQLAAKTIPNRIHCLSMRLTIDYYLLPLEKRKFPRSENLENPNLYHYALFSDNVLAASEAVNSTIMNAKVICMSFLSVALFHSSCLNSIS
jgi:hypothetical protein